LAFSPLALWAAVLFGLSAIPGPSLPPAAAIVGLDKVAHALLYGIFGFLCRHGLRGALPDIGPPTALLLVVFGAIAYGASDEIHQIFVPGRSADWHDVVADAAGSLFGGIVFQLLLLIMMRRRSHRDLSTQ